MSNQNTISAHTDSAQDEFETVNHAFVEASNNPDMHTRDGAGSHSRQAQYRKLQDVLALCKIAGGAELVTAKREA